jgi:hypothetical protein
MTTNFSSQRICKILTVAIFVLQATIKVPAQQQFTDAVIQKVDASVKTRSENIYGYTVTEHYAVYRNKDNINPVAEMTVDTSYLKDTGKSYVIVSKSGSEMIQNLVLNAILENEKHLNLPGVREGSWITSENYIMNLESSGTQQLDGRTCLLLSLTPRRKTPYLLVGTLWVDLKDGSIVQVQGTTSKSSSFLTGSTQVIRQYANINGLPQATHFKAVSNSFVFGQTIVIIDYLNYHVYLSRPM